MPDKTKFHSASTQTSVTSTQSQSQSSSAKATTEPDEYQQVVEVMSSLP